MRLYLKKAGGINGGITTDPDSHLYFGDALRYSIEPKHLDTYPAPYWIYFSNVVSFAGQHQFSYHKHTDMIEEMAQEISAKSSCINIHLRWVVVLFY